MPDVKANEGHSNTQRFIGQLSATVAAVVAVAVAAPAIVAVVPSKVEVVVRPAELARHVVVVVVVVVVGPPTTFAVVAV